jgi:hypothetical protein
MPNVMTLFKTSITGLGVCLTGAGMNYAVMFANGGRMPVFMDACGGYDGEIIDARHICGAAATHLVQLADYIRIGNYIYSPGDFLICAGQVLCVATAVLFIGARLVRIYRKN